jgi:hypothetical protein
MSCNNIVAAGCRLKLGISGGVNRNLSKSAHSIGERKNGNSEDLHDESFLETKRAFWASVVGKSERKRFIGIIIPQRYKRYFPSHFIQNAYIHSV